MITNLRYENSETALADGPMFDLLKVLDAAEAFVRGLVGDVLAAKAEANAFLRASGNQDRRWTYGDESFKRMRRTFHLWAQELDADSCSVTVTADVFLLRLYLLGSEGLDALRGWPPTLDTGASWEELDPTPLIQIMPSVGRTPTFGPEGDRYAQELVARHVPPGATFERFAPGANRVLTVRFPHEVFGAGHGSLRIGLLASNPVS